ncbi:MAG: ATP-binding protein [Geobacteraceae bacterium]|nr:ATP-binding protein [Geobacteraceae bacterium]
MRTPLLYSIKTKFVMIAALVLAIFSVTWGSIIIHEEKIHLLQNVEDDGKLLITSLKAPIINTMILGEMGVVPGLLDNFVEEIVKNTQSPTRYAFIADEHGKVLAHNRVEEYGRYYDDPLTRASLAGEGYRSRVVNDGSEHILDMAMPLRVAGKSWGALRIGLSMAPMEAEYARYKMQIVMFSALFFLTGTVIFYMVGHTMARPLKKLSRAMANINLGAFEIKPFTPRRDEIGFLQESFHDMLMRLERSEQERQNALNYVIQNEKMATIGKIVAGVAHEVNNPLAAISACIYNMAGKAPPESGNCLEILKAGISRIETIVHQLSDFSRSGMLELQYVASDAFFREMEAFAAMALKNHQVRLAASDQCVPPVVMHIDKGKLHQVVLNLLINAADASPEEGSVELSARASDGSYLLSVRDHGAGISAEDREHIFDIFFSTKPPGVGTGIGLAVCKSIVDLHRGTITVESKPGETTFSVAIPLENGAADA